MRVDLAEVALAPMSLLRRATNRGTYSDCHHMALMFHGKSEGAISGGNGCEVLKYGVKDYCRALETGNLPKLASVE